MQQVARITQQVASSRQHVAVAVADEFIELGDATLVECFNYRRIRLATDWVISDQAGGTRCALSTHTHTQTHILCLIYALPISQKQQQQQQSLHLPRPANVKRLIGLWQESKRM